MHISAAIEEYLACKKNTWTHESYRWYHGMLQQFFLWCEANELEHLSEITAPYVQAFVADNPLASDNTKHHRAQIVKGFLRWCAEDKETGVLEKTIKRIEMPNVEQGEVEIFLEEDIQRLLKACEKTRQPLRNRAIILLLLDTGIRISEICYNGTRSEEETGLLLENVIVGKRGTESYVIVMGKGRKPRTVKFGEETRLAIQKYVNHERPRVDIPYLFLALGGATPLSVRMLHQFLLNLGESAKVDGVHAHRFRHTFAIRQLLAGTSSLILMELMGHTTLEATKIYTRALTQMQARAASVSVVDEMWKSPHRRAYIRNAIERGRRR